MTPTRHNKSLPREMYRAVTVEVTQDDIDNGKPQQAYACPIALAASRTTGFPQDQVGVSDLLCVYGNRLDRYGPEDEREVLATYDLTGDAMTFIIDFDRGKEVEPFTFTATRRANRME